MCDAVVKNLPTNARDARDADSIPELIRFPEIGNGNLLQYSCLGNLMDKELDTTEHACTHMCGGILSESIPFNKKVYHRDGCFYTHSSKALFHQSPPVLFAVCLFPTFSLTEK